jgi:hypothetical protein
MSEYASRSTSYGFVGILPCAVCSPTLRYQESIDAHRRIEANLTSANDAQEEKNWHKLDPSQNMSVECLTQICFIFNRCTY